VWTRGLAGNDADGDWPERGASIGIMDWPLRKEVGLRPKGSKASGAREHRDAQQEQKRSLLNQQPLARGCIESERTERHRGRLMASLLDGLPSADIGVLTEHAFECALVAEAFEDD
jgi:hypothetical protein